MRMGKGENDVNIEQQLLQNEKFGNNTSSA